MNVLLWLVGFITAGITSFYMFRLWFMTFTGERREAEDAHGHDAHAPAAAHDDGHGHGGVHESPWVMLAPLVILAALSIGGGWMGAAKFEHFLQPAMYPLTQIAGEVKEATHEEGSMETILTIASVSIAAFGFLMAWFLYSKRRDLPDKITARLGVFYRAAYNKYWVDEIYGALIIRPIVWLSTFFLWKTVDVAIIDDSVNGLASGMRRASGETRQMQSGNIRSYAGWVAAGAAAVVAFMIWMSKGGWAR